MQLAENIPQFVPIACSTNILLMNDLPSDLHTTGYTVNFFSYLSATDMQLAEKIPQFSATNSIIIACSCNQ